MEKQVSIGKLTGMLKPKYRVISSILGETFNPENGTDIFIDLNSLVSAMGTNKKLMQSLPFSENVERDFIASTLAIVLHWKNFFRKYDTPTRIFLILNDFNMEGLYESKQLNSYLYPYKHKYEHERFNQLVYYWNESVNKIKIILNYIPNAYLIKCDRFDSYVIPNIIDDYENNNKHRVIVTSNSMFTNYNYMKNTSLMYSAWGVNGIAQLSETLMIVQKISKIDDEVMNVFCTNKVYYNLLNLIIGDFDRGILGLNQIGISRFATEIIRAIEQHRIPEDPKSVETILPVLDKAYHDYVMKSYPLVDIESHSNMIPKSQIEKVKSELIDLSDIDSLRKLSVDGLNLIDLL